MAYPFQQAARGNYSPGRAGPIQYIVVHYTANRGDTAKNNADYFARTVTKTSAHYFVDELEIWQSVLETDTAWHCGSDYPPAPVLPELQFHRRGDVQQCGPGSRGHQRAHSGLCARADGQVRVRQKRPAPL